LAGDPEIIVVNEIDEAVVVRQVSFNGCVWPQLLTFEDATSPRQCLPGADRVHFQRFDAESYCTTHVADGDLPELCFCDEDDAPPDDPFDLGIVDRTPLWFNYQTTYEVEAQRGDFVRVVLRLGEHEQDFGVLGPYGH
jgi:hypothetical protein